MAPTHDTAKNLIENAKGRVFTVSEACDFLDVLDSMPTGSYPDIRWVNVKTGTEVAIGRTGGSRKYQSGKDRKKKKIINPFLQVSNKKQFQALSKMHSRKLK